MTELAQGPVPASPIPAAPAVPAREGPLGHVADWFHAHGQHAAADVEHLAVDARSALEHAASALPVAVKVLNAAKLVDPADTELLTAFGDLLPEALAMAGKAVSDALAALKAA